VHNFHFFKFTDTFSKKSLVWEEISDIIFHKHGKRVTYESIRIRVALNRGILKEKLGLVECRDVACSNINDEKNSGIGGKNRYKLWYN